MSLLPCSSHSHMLTSMEMAEWTYLPRLHSASQFYLDYNIGVHAFSGLGGLSSKLISSFSLQYVKSMCSDQ